MLPLALGMAGAMARGQPLQAASWRSVHEKLQRRDTKLRQMQSEHETLFSTIEASANELPSSQQQQLRLMAVMASGVSATLDMLASLWDVVRVSAEVLWGPVACALSKAVRYCCWLLGRGIRIDL